MKNDSWFFSENLPFDSLFDLDGDGELSGLETMIRDDHWLNEFEDGAKPKIPDSLVEEGEQYCIYPENYDSAEEFQAALEEAKEIWRDADEDDAGAAYPAAYGNGNTHEGPVHWKSKDEEELHLKCCNLSLKEINHLIQESKEKIKSLQKQLDLIQEENRQAEEKKKTRAIVLFGSAIGISLIIGVVFSLSTWGEFIFSEAATLAFWLSLSFCCFIGLGYAFKQNMDKENRSERFLKVFRIADDVKKEEQKLSNLISEREQIKDHRN